LVMVVVDLSVQGEGGVKVTIDKMYTKCMFCAITGVYNNWYGSHLMLNSEL
jgi:hypothetical protein